ncbi:MULTISPECIES: hypothetical protein [Burkholderia]|uniref:Glycosyltransferase n=1 Tax=Burkholderia cenocepacia TaxID=95486 RepID=A0ABD4UEF8_9BURK|nr:MULTISPECIES: hypothetical protein [Burkholderia]MBR8094928.1 hypothetical protein [Burkholderia cenocepacia]MBS6359077.1 hypothetical protein [Burkholderia sp.]MBY4714270.1 hypothetical protein [Burkholderia cepacia]MBY4740091.1 hypothetical protein [Burkholderia cepacia]MBY4743397.1 hypothetical protein [Burkholderia cepacia]
MSELFAVTTYFNPCGYATRRRNYDLFIEGMRRAGVPCLTVECAFGDDPFELPESLDVIRVRSRTLLWQKERLLNMAEPWLPASCKGVIWIDCDILFESETWPEDLLRVLHEKKVAQVFETCLRLERGNIEGAKPDIARSFAAMMNSKPSLLNAGRYDLHGHTGYGWAMRREIFAEVGLYEHAISGSADHFMAHAIFGDYNFCIQNALKHDRRQIAHLKQWGDRFHRLVQGSLGVVPGQIRHLWHGDAVNRRYFLRMHDITDLGFDPWTDLLIQPGKPLEWAPGLNKPGLVQYFANYFASRQEDGALAA